MPQLPHHLLGVWNPSYASDAMEATLQLLLASAANYRSGSCDEEDVYVWWGKVRSSNRQAPLKHLGEVVALDDELSGDAGPQRESTCTSPTIARSTSRTWRR